VCETGETDRDLSHRPHDIGPWRARRLRRRGLVSQVGEVTGTVGQHGEQPRRDLLRRGGSQDAGLERRQLALLRVALR
jgi:hypothetical protein